MTGQVALFVGPVLQALCGLVSDKAARDIPQIQARLKGLLFRPAPGIAPASLERIRRLLVYLIDELVLAATREEDTAFHREWVENSFEVAIYNRRLRSEAFWEELN